MRRSSSLYAWWVVVACAGCGGSAPPRVEHPQGPPREHVPLATVEEAKDRQVGVVGIEGTLSEFEVRTTMEKRLDDLADCQAQRMHDVPHLAGDILVGIHVLRDGVVSQASVRSSSVGDRITERCILDVIRAARFPRPRGGEADVTWSMSIDERGGGPVRWKSGRIKRQLARYKRPLRETCELHRGATPLAVTAYVGRSGHVLAAGAASKETVPDALLDCVVESVEQWRMPKSKRVAKVSFDLR